ncbi:MAG: tRNA-binding protein [Candidatus Micrarchaeota archaeon]
MTVSWDDFEAVGLRAGTIIRVEDFPEARKPAYRIWVDFGELGVRQSSAQLTRLYSKDSLVGLQVVCVTGFPPKRVAGFVSEVLITGFVLENGDVVLAQPERRVPNGAKLA